MRKLLSLMAILVGGLPIIAHAINFSFLTTSESPAQYFNDKDWNLFNDAIKDALNKAPNGAKVAWKNPESGAAGYFMPINMYTVNDVPCRQMKIVNFAHDKKERYTFSFCKFENGWKIPGESV